MTVPRHVPPFYCPVPAAEHPRGDAVDRLAVSRMLAAGLCRPDSRLTRIGVGVHLALCYPYCVRQEHLDIAADLNYLGFAFDDAHVTDAHLRTCAGLAPAIGRLLAVLDSPEAPVQDPYQGTLRDIIVRLTAATTPGNVLQVTDGLRKALLYTLWHMSVWERGEIPDLDDYTTIRINDDGGPWFTAFAPVCGGYELTAATLRSPRIRALSQAVALAAGIDNDIFSFQREDAVGEKNILHILMRDHDCPADQAMHATIALRNRVVYLYARLRDQVAADGDPIVGRYAHDIGHVVRGNLKWSHATDRYRAAVPVQVILTDQSTDIDPSPISLPSIAWWWDLL
jgi:hypothetical protein